MIWHFLEVWALLLAAFAIGGALGTLLYMALAVSPLADAQIGVADAIADRLDAIRDAVGRRRDTGLYRGQHPVPPPAFVAAFPPPPAAVDPHDDPDPAPKGEDSYWHAPEETVAVRESDHPEPITGEAEEYWEDDEWAPDEDDVHWAEDYEWPAEEETAAVAEVAMSAPATGTPDLLADASSGAAEPSGGMEESPVGIAAVDEPLDDDDATTVAETADETAAEEEEDELLVPEEATGESDAGSVAVLADPVSVRSESSITVPMTASNGESAPSAGGAVAIVGVGEASPEADREGSETEAEAVASLAKPQEAEDTEVAARAAETEAHGRAPAAEPGMVESVARESEGPLVPPSPPEGAVAASLDPQGDPAAPGLVLPATAAPTAPTVRAPPSRRGVAQRPASAEPATRPLALSAPRNGVPDNLQRIRGIGQKNEELLNALGIFHFGQIAAWTPAEARWIANQLAFPERLERDDWVGQAIVFATGGDTGYVKAPARRKDDDEAPVAA